MGCDTCRWLRSLRSLTTGYTSCTPSGCKGALRRPGLIIQTIETTEQFLQLREEWNALLHVSTSNCVFLTHEWMWSWWKHLAEGRRLAILTPRDGQELAGILPVA